MHVLVLTIEGNEPLDSVQCTESLINWIFRIISKWRLTFWGHVVSRRHWLLKTTGNTCRLLFVCGVVDTGTAKMGFLTKSLLWILAQRVGIKCCFWITRDNLAMFCRYWCLLVTGSTIHKVQYLRTGRCVSKHSWLMHPQVCELCSGREIDLWIFHWGKGMQVGRPRC